MIIGVDIGTSGARALFVDEFLNVVSSGTSSYGVLTPRPGIMEQNPEEVFVGVMRSIGSCLKAYPCDPSSVKGIALSSYHHSFLPVDDSIRPISNILTWGDLRAHAEAKELKELPNQSRRIYVLTGCPVHPMYLPAKLLWLKKNSPESFSMASKFLSVKDYIIYRLTGEVAVDISVASTSGLFDIHKKAWSEQVLNIIGVDPTRLSQVVSPFQGFPMRPEIADALGLHKRVMVFAGAGDGVLNSLGCGAVSEWQATFMIGTSGAVRVVKPYPVIDDRMRTWCYMLTEDRYVLGAAINTGGIAIQWFGKAFLDSTDYDSLICTALNLPPGAMGLIFLPFMAGERSPFWRDSTRGAIIGLSLSHDKGHMARALMEGIGFSMRSILEPIIELSPDISELRATGGFARSEAWLRLMADMINFPLSVPSVEQSSALGAAMLGLKALGALQSLEALSSLITIEKRIYPSPHREIYDELYKKYLDCYFALVPLWEG